MELLVCDSISQDFFDGNGGFPAGIQIPTNSLEVEEENLEREEKALFLAFLRKIL
jgi:hypothetical protein